MLTAIIVLVAIALLIVIYPFAGAFVVAMGIGNDSHFRSPYFQTERIKLLLGMDSGTLPSL